MNCGKMWFFVVPSTCLLYFYFSWKSPTFPRMTFNNLRRAGVTLPHSALGLYGMCRWRERWWCGEKLFFPLREKQELCCFPHVLKLRCIMVCWSCWEIATLHGGFLSVGLLSLMDKVWSKTCSENCLQLKFQFNFKWRIYCNCSGLSCLTAALGSSELHVINLV